MGCCFGCQLWLQAVCSQPSLVGCEEISWASTPPQTTHQCQLWLWVICSPPSLVVHGGVLAWQDTGSVACGWSVLCPIWWSVVKHLSVVPDPQGGDLFAHCATKPKKHLAARHEIMFPVVVPRLWNSFLQEVRLAYLLTSSSTSWDLTLVVLSHLILMLIFLVLYIYCCPPLCCSTFYLFCHVLFIWDFTVF